MTSPSRVWISPHDDGPVPARALILVGLIEQRVAQKMMGVQHERRLTVEIGHDDPLLAGSVDPLKERIVRRRIEYRQEASAARKRQADNALRVHRLSLVGNRQVVEIEKVLDSGRFQLTDVAAAGSGTRDQGRTSRS
jgi:hypothetical protein